MPKSIFVTLPVRDLAAAARFYAAIGCKKNDAFSDATAATMVWSDTISIQLQTREAFGSWLPKKVADARESCEVFLGLSLDRREDVDALCQAAAEHGGKADVRAPVDMGWLYNRALEDPDGHVLEAYWLDPKGM